MTIVCIGYATESPKRLRWPRAWGLNSWRPTLLARSKSPIKPGDYLLDLISSLGLEGGNKAYGEASTSTGDGADVPVLPSWPYQLSPQHFAVPSEAVAQVK